MLSQVNNNYQDCSRNQYIRFERPENRTQARSLIIHSKMYTEIFRACYEDSWHGKTDRSGKSGRQKIK